MNSTEIPKRLTPTPETLRVLYLLSGNECAFEGCGHPIIDQDGVYVAQLCHIEAAEPKGERFNESMTNEERRTASNLLLMCHRHHKVTNDVAKYPVAVMQSIKARHEERFSDGLERMIAAEVDQTLSAVVTPPKTLAGIYAASGWTFDEEEHAFNVACVVSLGERLRPLSRPARQVLEMVVRRGHSVPGGELGLLVRELTDITGAGPADIAERVGQLEGHRFAYIEHDGGFDEMAGPFVSTWVRNDEWPTLIDLRNFCDNTETPLATLIVDLDFSVLDEA